MQRVQDISLLEVFSKYFQVKDITKDGNHRYKCVCPFHNDHSPSMAIYDNTEKGEGWDYHCFVCGAHGTAPVALVAKGFAESEEDAITLLRTDFGLSYPDKVTLVDFCASKGLNLKFVEDNGWKDGEHGIRIPFLNTKGDPINIKVRTKYTGSPKYYYEMPNAVLEPYGLHWLDAYEDDILYLAEGETDTVTLRQAGFPVIGFGGARTFDPMYTKYLKRFKRLALVKDNDEAGWELVKDMAKVFPTNLHVVPLPADCKDVNNFHQYRCSSNPIRFGEAFKELGMVPSSPEAFIEAVKNKTVSPTDKGCWDMVLRTITAKADRLMFKEEFAKETKVGKAIITACLSDGTPSKKTKADTTFAIVDNCYIKEVFRDGTAVQERISNFILNPKCDIVSDDGTIRVCDLVNSSGRTARNVHFDSETLSSTVKFNQQVLSAGDFIFTGVPEDLFNLCMVIFNVPKEVVHSPRTIGHLPSGEWLFGNCGIDASGEVVLPDDDGIIKLGTTAYKPRSVSISDESGDTGNSTDMPIFDIRILRAGYEKDYLPRLARSFRDCFGTYGAWMGLGWVVAGWHSDAIFEELGSYPYLFVTGKRASGKSVHCELLQQSFGFNPSQCGMSIESPTNVGMLRYLTYRSSLPQWYDDYRNGVKRIQTKDNLLLDIYNRHGSVKGNKSGGVVQEQVKGFVLLSGEDTPSNNALTTRCVITTLSEYIRDASKMEECRELFSRLPCFGLSWAAEATKTSSHLIREILAVKSTILAASGDIRDAQNKAVFAGAFIHAFGAFITDKEKEEFIAYVCGNSVEQVAHSNSEHPMAQFFNDMPNYGDLITRNSDYLIEGKYIFLRMPALYKAWEDYHNRAVMLSSQVLIKYLKQEPSYVGEERRVFDKVGRQRCLKIDTSRMTDEFMDFKDYFIMLGGNKIEF